MIEKITAARIMVLINILLGIDLNSSLADDGTAFYNFRFQNISFLIILKIFLVFFSS